MINSPMFHGRLVGLVATCHNETTVRLAFDILLWMASINLADSRMGLVFISLLLKIIHQYIDGIMVSSKSFCMVLCSFL